MRFALGDGGLLLLVGHELTTVAGAEPKWWPRASEESMACLLVALHLSDPFTDAVALKLDEGRSDRHEQSRQAFAGDVAAKVKEMPRLTPLD